MAIQSAPYGRDTSCTTRLLPGRVVTGARLLAEAAFRRITTPRGRLLDDPSYGVSVSEILNSDMTENELLSIPAKLRSEILKDKRIDTVNIDQTVEREPWKVTLDIEGVASNGEPFSLSVAVSDVTVELLRAG